MEIDKSDPCFFGVNLENDLYQVSFELTNCCNLECKHCFNKSDKVGHNGLNKEEVFVLIDELAELGINNVYITGGEPTCYPYFYDVVNYFIKNNIEVILATNAYDISSYIDFLKEKISKKAGVFVSIDGIEGIHDEFRNKIGAFDKTIDNIRLLIECGIPVRISSVVWKKNVYQIEEMIELAKSLGVYQIHFTIPIKVGRAQKNDIEAVEPYSKLVRMIEVFAQKHSTDSFQVSLRRNKVVNQYSLDCKAGTKILHISSNGLISPCSWLAKSDTSKYSLKWEKGKLDDCISKIRSFSEIVQIRKNKNGCSGCPAMASIYYNNILADDPLNNLLAL